MSQFCIVRVYSKDHWDTYQTHTQYRLRKTELARLQKAAELTGTTAEEILYKYGLINGLKYAAKEIKLHA